MEDRSYRRMRTLVTKWPIRGRSGNKTARALISMMARSTTRSNQKPDTLMQDRTSARSTKPSCNARPDHTLGSKARIPFLSVMSAFAGRGHWSAKAYMLKRASFFTGATGRNGLRSGAMQTAWTSSHYPLRPRWSTRLSTRYGAGLLTASDGT